MPAKARYHNNKLEINIERLMEHPDPYSTYTQMRNEFPICQIASDNSWAVSRFNDVKYILDNPEDFSSEGYKSLLQPDWLDGHSERGNFLVFEAPTSHTLHRSMANKAFIKSVINSLIPFMRDSAQSLVKKIVKKEKTDFVESFSYPYVCDIIGRITGTDEIGRLNDIREWVILGESITTSRPDNSKIESIKAALDKQNHYFNLVIKDRKANPKSDLIGKLVSAEFNGTTLTDSLLRGALELLISASFQTTAHMLSNCMIQLAHNPEILKKLIASPDLIPDFIEEMLRFNPPGHCVLRKATRNTSLSGITFQKGDVITCLLASANRDQEQFEKPDDFIMGRHNIKKHLAFGHGIHVCIGAALARIELKVALEEILKAFRKISCPKNEDILWANSYTTHGPRILPITFE